MSALGQQQPLMSLAVDRLLTAISDHLIQLSDQHAEQSLGTTQ